jgi:hypothetical protein
VAISDPVHSLHSEAIPVLDRGGDRSNIIDCFVADRKLFVIRCQDQRSLRLHLDSKKLTNIREIAKKKKTSYAYKSLTGAKTTVKISPGAKT